MKKFCLFITAFVVATVALSHWVVADHRGEERDLESSSDRDDDRHGERHRNGAHDRGGLDLNPVSDPTYKEKCGACHLAYTPGLLPAESWRKMLSQPEDHFGESLDLDPEAKNSIANYLEANSADRSTAKRSVKIMRSLGSQAPMRITEIPLFRKKHHEISAAVLQRQSIGSLSNCSACHARAEEGIYDDDEVVIPN